MKKMLVIFLLFMVGLIILGLTYIGKQLPYDIPVPPLSEIKTIEGIVKPYIENKTTKGLSIGTYKDGKIDFYNYGICSDKNPIAPTQYSIYEIGSITKTFTTAVLAQMVTEGKVKYEDRIAQFLPEGICKWPTEKAITLEELATHNSSLPRIPSNMMKRMVLNMSNPYKNYTVTDMYDFLKTFKPQAVAERKTEYSNLGMGLLGHILVDVDGLSYEAMLQKRIFTPLGMNNSLIEIEEGQLIQGHDGSGKPTSQWDIPTLAGAGAIRSNTEDMMKYLIANIQNQAPFAETHILRKDLTDFQKIGLAWIGQKNGAMDILWHNGGTGGFRTFMGFTKTEKMGVVVLSNSVQGVDEVGIRILEFLEDSQK